MARSIHYRLGRLLLFLLLHWFRLSLLLNLLWCILRQVHVSCEQLRQLVLLHVGLLDL